MGFSILYVAEAMQGLYVGGLEGESKILLVYLLILVKRGIERG